MLTVRTVTQPIYKKRNNIFRMHCIDVVTAVQRLATPHNNSSGVILVRTSSAAVAVAVAVPNNASIGLRGRFIF